MNKKMRELLSKIEELNKDARKALDDKEVDKSISLLDDIDALKKEYEAEKRLYEAEKEKVPEEPVKKKEQESSEKAFAAAARSGFQVEKDMSEGVKTSGGYTVPQDIQTKINLLRETNDSLQNMPVVSQ